MMKKLLVLVTVIALYVLFAIPVCAADLFNSTVSVGCVGTNGAKNAGVTLPVAIGFRKNQFGVEIGMISFPHYPQSMAISGSPFILNNSTNEIVFQDINGVNYRQVDKITSSYSDYDANYRTEAYGVDLLYYYDASKNWTLYAGPGLYGVTIKRIIYSTTVYDTTITNTDTNTIVTSTSSSSHGYYTQEQKNQNEVSFNIGAQYKLNDSSQVALRFGYHSIRGVYIGFAASF